MMSVLPNGGCISPLFLSRPVAALDDVSATEWRIYQKLCTLSFIMLHSMMSVLPNGGAKREGVVPTAPCCTR